jgi:hypothetical protein
MMPFSIFFFREIPYWYQQTNNYLTGINKQTNKRLDKIYSFLEIRKKLLYSKFWETASYCPAVVERSRETVVLGSGEEPGNCCPR